jgi:hypothetical protein
MKKFIVKETRPAMATWTYEVEAKSESEAMAKVFDEWDVKKADLTYDVDFEADMGIEIDEEISTSECECIPGCDCNKIGYTFTEQELIEFTREIQSRALEAAVSAIESSGVDMESHVELELNFGNQIDIEVDEDTIYSVIVDNVRDVFETDNDSIKDEINNVFNHLFKGF